MEADGNLQKLNENLLKLEKLISDQVDTAKHKAIIDELMRSAHTIKGSSATMGFVKLGFLAHVMEDIFDSARNDQLTITIKIVNKVFIALDKIKVCLKSIKDNDSEIDLQSISDELKSITGVETEGVGKSVKKTATPQKDQTNQGVKKEKTGAELAAEAKAEALREIAEMEAKKQAAGGSPKEETQEAKTGQTERSANIGGKEDPFSFVSSEVAKIDYIKVSISRLDALMDLVEELLIDKMRLEQLRNRIPEIKDISDHISLLTSGIQYQVMQARLVPVDQVFQMFPRMVRDLAYKLGKKINFITFGGDIELDRTIVDKLGEPLVHLLRNAVDHGIAKQGNLKLEAIRESDYVLIIVENDDKGIDFNKVKHAAVKKGIVSEKEIESYREDQLVSLLFHPRLSTNDEVTEISGRGVGLSVVKSFIDELSGQVSVENLPEGGVRFVLKLPLTLAIINSLLVQVKNEIFAIPFNNIERSVSVSKDNIKKMADQEVAIIDGIDVPLIKLAEIFHLIVDEETPQEAIEKATEKESALSRNFSVNQDNLIVVIMRKDGEFVGVVVDSLINRQEIIIKPLSPVLRGMKGLAGSTILGDGKTILILDVINLIKTIA